MTWRYGVAVIPCVSTLQNANYSVLSHPQTTMALFSSPQSLSVISSNGIGNATPRTRRSTTTRRRPYLVVNMAASDASIGAFEEGRLVRPKWTGHTPLSRLVAVLISFKPLYSILKLGARQVLIRSVPRPTG